MILHTELKGSGEALVFLPSGLQTSATDFLSQQARFSKDYQVIAPDLRGHGRSSSSDISNFFEDSAMDLEETLEALGVHSAHIAGASLGALVAIYFAKRFPRKVKSLTVSGVTKRKPANWQELHKEDSEMQKTLLENPEAINYFTDLHGPGWERFISIAMDEHWYPFNETASLSTISAPVMVIAGEGSPHESISAYEYRLEQNNVHYSIIPFASHLVHTEQPELYSDILELFLKISTNTEAQV